MHTSHAGDRITENVLSIVSKILIDVDRTAVIASGFNNDPKIIGSCFFHGFIGQGLFPFSEQQNISGDIGICISPKSVAR